MRFLLVASLSFVVTSCAEAPSPPREDSKPDSEHKPLADGALAISCGTSHMCALLNNNQVKCWGENYKNQLDMKNATNASRKKFDVRSSKFSHVSAGFLHSCGILQDSSKPVCCGDLGSQLEVPDEPVKDISAGFALTCFLKMNSSLECVGDGVKYGAEKVAAKAIVKSGFDPATGADGQDFSKKKFKSVKVSQSHVCAMDLDDVVYCMGIDVHGSKQTPLSKSKDFAVTFFLPIS